jgi:hypothetical protein
MSGYCGCWCSPVEVLVVLRSASICAGATCAVGGGINWIMGGSLAVAAAVVPVSTCWGKEVVMNQVWLFVTDKNKQACSAVSLSGNAAEEEDTAH